MLSDVCMSEFMILNKASSDQTDILLLCVVNIIYEDIDSVESPGFLTTKGYPQPLINCIH